MSPSQHPPLEYGSDHPALAAARRFGADPFALLGLVLFISIVLVTLLGLAFSRASPFDIVGGPHAEPFVTPGLRLGTDYLGRDLVIGLWLGGIPTLTVAFLSALIATALGAMVGALAGYFGGIVDQVLMRVTEFFQILPALLFAMVLVGLFGASVITLSVVIGLVSWPPCARIARAEFLRIRSEDYVRAARSHGASHVYIIFRVIFPNALAPLLVTGTLTVGLAILFESGLSFLGLGDPNVMSWGLMIGTNREWMLEAWWPVAFPGLAIFITVLSICLIGDGLNDALNPRLAHEQGDA